MQIVKTFESFHNSFDIEIFGSPSDQIIKISESELRILTAEGLVFSDKTVSIPEIENPEPISTEGKYTFMDINLEKIEEILHRDVDHDNEAGEDPVHVAKVLGDDSVLETTKSEYQKVLENNTDKNNIVHGYYINGVYGWHVDLDVHNKKEIESKKLYAKAKNKLVLVEISRTSNPQNFDNETAYYLNPKIVEHLNSIGVNLENLINIKRKMFISMAEQLSIGNVKAFDDVIDIITSIKTKE